MVIVGTLISDNLADKFSAGFVIATIIIFAAALVVLPAPCNAGEKNHVGPLHRNQRARGIFLGSHSVQVRSNSIYPPLSAITTRSVAELFPTAVQPKVLQVPPVYLLNGAVRMTKQAACRNN